MKTTRLTVSAICLAAMILVSGCAMNKTGKGALIGTGAGAALGAGVGALIGGKQGAAMGAAIGGAVGAGTGAVIGHRMDKQAEELARIENAKVEKVEDVNGLTAIRVTFDGGILFAFNSDDLSAGSRTALTNFATSLKNNPDTDVTIYGHTDNVGTLAANERVSLRRAEAVAAFLRGQGITSSRIISVQGMAFNYPVASNDTAEGRAQNRRVEIYITANEKMISDAQQGF